MPTQLDQFTVYVPRDLLERLKSAAAADGRTLSNFAARKLAELSGPEVAAVPDRRSIHRGRQVDLAEAIADAVKRGPSKPQRRAKPK